jgi:hypothetical protein
LPRLVDPLVHSDRMPCGLADELLESHEGQKKQL